MPDLLTAVAALSLVIWLYLVLCHGNFWRADQRLPEQVRAEPPSWPGVVAVIPARNEHDVVDRAVASLIGQDYPGDLAVVLVDDRSDDGTGEAARTGAAACPDRLTVIEGQPLEDGWSGKMWAVSQGADRAGGAMPDARYLLLTDADIEHGRDAVRRLVAKAEAERLDLVSLMVRLHCRSAIERLLIPAFVYFFQQVYPFPRANDPLNPLAAAAGGCMLVRREALVHAGGIESIRDALIDDCALAARLKPNGPIWIGLAEESRSIRPYDGLADIWRMVARTAFTQLRHSPLRLAGTVVGLALTYLVPPVALGVGLVTGNGQAAALAAIAWGLMVMSYAPTLRLYGLSVANGLLLPAVAVLYTLMTVDSARRHWQGRGGAWKGRTYSGLAKS